MSCPYFYNKKERKNCSFYASIGSPKKRNTLERVCFLFAIQGIAEPKWVRSLGADAKPLANYRLPSPYQGAETRRGHQPYTLPNPRLLGQTEVCFSFPPYSPQVSNMVNIARFSRENRAFYYIYAIFYQSPCLESHGLFLYLSSKYRGNRGKWGKTIDH